ncbi:VTC domain-containing protein [Desulfofustis limnaeus]|jgi:hypothetical protein|uniref:VTC domain-containing protein n=1 Tax=Desulfofustis limnaeus TaxID=2740163 RepID=A0ABM7W4N7_9BACT|nr:VTC domain-containing protein [Desulfofustis limnaeus]MDX9894074.1 VTC domain-containing protein [Desulfofustis sp.]BDD85872.1 hypothetical protein DPPLL_02370 [Desulfofustis limnaeus]
MSTAQSSAEYEIKYILANERARSLRHYLAKRYCADGAYAAGYISSIYFDTADLSLLDEKLNSDYLKIKVRLRWYGSTPAAPPAPPFFLEVKRKIGSTRKKTRKCFVDGSETLLQPLHHPDFFKFATILGEAGEYFGKPLFPVLQISYYRTRYIDPCSGTRFAVDSDIHVPRINRRFVSRCNGQPLPTAVFECKGHSPLLPDWLTHINALADCRKDAFSKYAACLLTTA